MTEKSNSGDVRQAGLGPRRWAVAPLLIGAGLLAVTVFASGAALLRSAGPVTPASAQEAVDTSMFTDAQKKAIEQIAKDYLIKHPEIFLDIQNALDAKLQKEEAERIKAVISQNAKDIYRHPNAPIAGNPDGDITVVEFFDYNCGYCKRGFGEVAKLVASDPKARVVFKEFPILRKESEEAARVALAARGQGKYWEMHQALIETKGMVNLDVGLKAAEKLGLDLPKLKADMQSEAVSEELKRVQDLAKKMGINGTPHFLVGDRSIGGAPENLFELLTQNVAELRKSGCSYC